MSGFYIKRVKVTGSGKEDAEVIFTKGLNVVHGPSNTGKSFIFQCIDYAFGASKIKSIPESKGYSKLYVEIRSIDDNTPITILRFLDNNDIFYFMCKIDDINDMQRGKKLKAKHDPDGEDNISRFLLKQIGIFDNIYLVTNKNGVKKTLGFRAIAHLSIISETDIISEEKSPVVETQNTQQTYSKSAFRYLLTNQDDVACKEIEKVEIRKAKNDAKIDYIRNEIIDLNQEREKLIEEKNDFDDDINDLDYYRDKIIEIECDIQKKRQAIHDTNTVNNKLNLQKNKTQIMLDKFQLLKKQYLSDIERLEFLSTGGTILSQIPMQKCPLCESEIPHMLEESNTVDIFKCSNDEKVKIQISLSELEVSINDLNKELQSINEMLLEGEDKAKEYEVAIKQISTKDLKPIKSIMKTLIEQAKVNNKILNINSIIERKSGEVIVFEESKKVKEDSVTDGLVIEQKIYDDLCDEIKNSLISCGYINVENVTFDVKTQDIVIDGVHRLANGKGFRAFFYAVFSASLISYLQKIEHLFSQVLVLDSPLTTLKESEISEAIEDDFVDSTLQNGLFKFFAENFTDKQVIIIDNKQPPVSLMGKYNDIVFTKGSSEGRYGFF